MMSGAAFPRPSRWIDRLARRLVLHRLSRLERGRVALTDADGQHLGGTTGPLAAALRVHDPRFYSRVLRGGTLAVAEGYLRGQWECDDLVGLLRLFARNRAAATRFDFGLARLRAVGERIAHAWSANSRRGSRRNIAAHYDLGNDFFRLWLDETMAYSCGLFATSEATLAEASTAKFERVCQLLELDAADELLEIGGGWGGLALHAAQRHGCQVTTTTISSQQAELARRRVAEAGVAQQVTVLEQDYRDLRGRFDKLASIEMVEAVGDRYLDAFFAQCSRLLRPAGSFVLQAIVMPERGYSRYLRSVDFIQRYVFPGGCLPSVGRILEAVARATDFRLQAVEDFAPHYAETLRRWRAGFEASRPQAREQGYPEAFLRLWDYYLSYCEAAFEERLIGVVQIVFDKPRRRRGVALQARAAARVHHASC